MYNTDIEIMLKFGDNIACQLRAGMKSDHLGISPSSDTYWLFDVGKDGVIPLSFSFLIYEMGAIKVLLDMI